MRLHCLWRPMLRLELGSGPVEEHRVYMAAGSGSQSCPAQRFSEPALNQGAVPWIDPHTMLMIQDQLRPREQAGGIGHSRWSCDEGRGGAIAGHRSVASLGDL